MCMKTQQCAAAGDSLDSERRRRNKQLKLLRDDEGCSGGDWSWRTLLQKLHFFLDNETDGDSLAWLEDGVHFVVHQTSEARLETWLGLRVCSLRQVLETLNFQCREELHWEYAIYHHDCFVRGNPRKIEEMLGSDTSAVSTRAGGMVMPNVTYSSRLKPLEIRLSLSDSHSQSWEVTIAPSVLPHPTFDVAEAFRVEESFGAGSSADEASWDDVFEHSDEWSDHDVSSPMWWSQRSDFSSICTDDLSDMDTLSQLSTYFG